uniref:Uncharacterized protein n=1 Tax=Triticum urartu TaxID=4572 RepID=A0A8R7P407_TRIUA
MFSSPSTKMGSDGNGPPTVATPHRAPTSFSLLAELSPVFLELIWHVTTNVHDLSFRVKTYAISMQAAQELLTAKTPQACSIHSLFLTN